MINSAKRQRLVAPEAPMDASEAAAEQPEQREQPEQPEQPTATPEQPAAGNNDHISITVQDLEGNSFKVKLRRNDQIDVLKDAIQMEREIPKHRQEIYALGQADDLQLTLPNALQDDHKLDVECTVALCVTPDWFWDINSHNCMKDEFFAVSPAKNICTRIKPDRPPTPPPPPPPPPEEERFVEMRVAVPELGEYPGGPRLRDSFEINTGTPHYLTLQVNVPPTISVGEMIAVRVAESVLTGHNTNAPQPTAPPSHPQQLDYCMMAGPAIFGSSGTHTISFKLSPGAAAAKMSVAFGVVQIEGPAWISPEELLQQGFAMFLNASGRWLMHSSTGAIQQDSERHSNAVGRISPEQVVTMQLDTNKGTLKFWVDGKPHGPGFASGVVAPTEGTVRWITKIGELGNTVTLVPTPELQPWSFQRPAWDSDSD